MNRFFSLLLGAAALLAACTAAPQGGTSNEPPHLEKRGPVTQLIVKGEPYLALASELRNSSATSPAYMEPLWDNLKEGGMNTVLAVVQWEQVEPVEGQFDFTVVDEMIKAARAHDLKLCVLWFGSWKNGMSSYHPVWVKKDNNRFPLALTKEGKKLPILTTLGEETVAADAKAYAELMKHIKKIDAAEQTVIMIQMENEVGLHGYARDYCPAANAAFAGPVPAELIQWLSAHKDSLLPETREAWENSGCKTSGTWEEVFGEAAESRLLVVVPVEPAQIGEGVLEPAEGFLPGEGVRSRTNWTSKPLVSMASAISETSSSRDWMGWSIMACFPHCGRRLCRAPR